METTLAAMLFTMMPMFVCAFWALVTICDLLRGQRQRHKMALAVFMTTAATLYLGHFTFFNHAEAVIPLTDTLYCMSNLAVYPLYYIYICMLTHRQEQLWHNLLWLLPAAGAGLTVGTLYLLMTPAECQQFTTLYLYQGVRAGLSGLAEPMASVHDVCKALFALLIIPVFVLGRHHIRKFDQLVKDAYADTENKTLAPIHYMLTVFVLTTAASFIANIIGRQFFAETMWLLGIPATLFSVMLFCLGYIGHNQQFSIEDIEADEKQADDTTAQAAAEFTSELSQRISQLMDTEKLFLQPNLKIMDLVQHLGTNRTYIYQTINREMGLSFSEYVNRLRIDYAEQLIIADPDRPVTEVAEQSGFTSSTSFYRNFRLYKGIGPKEYQNKLKGTP